MNETNGTITAIHSMNVLVKLGVPLNQTIEDAISMAKKFDCSISFVFNDLKVTVNKESTVEDTINKLNE
jgi:hypothetical protein